jgi:hypothetical protein
MSTPEIEIDESPDLDNPEATTRLNHAGNGVVENIEGLGKPDEDGTWGDYPIDTVLIRHETRTVHDVLRRIDSGAYVMNPDFQRDFIWPTDKQSKLIESVMMRIPLPVIYLAEDNKGRMIVVDGLQRLSTFQRFVGNKLRLRLPDQKELDKKLFQDLSPKLQNRVEDCNLILYIIDSKVPERARLDIFERVNAGMSLTRQQMRNSLYMGPATRFLKAEAATDLFREATGGSLNTSTMRDREFVNRFCAFYLQPVDEYRGDMDDFLARGLKLMNETQAGEISVMRAAFHTSLNNNLFLFGRNSFRKHTADQDSRGVINASLWDVMSTGLANYSEAIVKRKANELKEAFYVMIVDPDFNSAITYGPNHTKKVRCRFEKAEEMFVEVFGD